MEQSGTSIAKGYLFEAMSCLAGRVHGDLANYFDDQLFLGIFMARGDRNKREVSMFCHPAEMSDDADIELLACWLYDSSRPEYGQGVFRVDLQSSIVIFKIYPGDDSEYLIGYALERTHKTRAMLLETRQKYLQEQFRYA